MNYPINLTQLSISIWLDLPWLRLTWLYLKWLNWTPLNSSRKLTQSYLITFAYYNIFGSIYMRPADIWKHTFLSCESWVEIKVSSCSWTLELPDKFMCLNKKVTATRQEATHLPLAKNFFKSEILCPHSLILFKNSSKTKSKLKPWCTENLKIWKKV